MAATAVTRITRLYTGGDGHSHFDDIELEMPLFESGTLRNLRTTPLPVQELVFRESFLATGQVLRSSLKRQLIVTLSGAAEIIVQSGDSRVFGAGDTLLAEDLSGSGHRARELLGPRRCLVLSLADDFDLRAWLASAAESGRCSARSASSTNSPAKPMRTSARATATQPN